MNEMREKSERNERQRQIQNEGETERERERERELSVRMDEVMKRDERCKAVIDEGHWVYRFLV